MRGHLPPGSQQHSAHLCKPKMWYDTPGQTRRCGARLFLGAAPREFHQSSSPSRGAHAHTNPLPPAGFLHLAVGVVEACSTRARSPPSREQADDMRHYARWIIYDKICAHYRLINEFWSTYFIGRGGDKLRSPLPLELWVYFFLPSVVHIHQQLPWTGGQMVCQKKYFSKILVNLQPIPCTWI